MEGSRSSVEDRLGALASEGWIPLPLMGLRVRAALGTSQTQVIVIAAICSFLRRPGGWPSIAQDVIARQLGLTRESVNRALRGLIESGLLATSPDLRRPTPGRCVLHYCAEPYLIASLAQAAKTVAQAVAAQSQLACFAKDVAAGRWDWRVGDKRSGTDSPAELVALFERRFLKTEM